MKTGQTARVRPLCELESAVMRNLRRHDQTWTLSRSMLADRGFFALAAVRSVILARGSGLARFGRDA